MNNKEEFYAYMRNEALFDEITKEREYQDGKWGGPTHDDLHDEEEWMDILEHYATGGDEGLHDFRTSMVKVAAIAVAAIESYDRKNA